MNGSITLDGEEIGRTGEDNEYYVGISFPAENGYEPTMPGIDGWCNSIGVRLRDETGFPGEQSIQLSISIADPRGALQMEVTASAEHGFRLSVPHPSDGMLHVPLTQLNDGFYKIGGVSYPELDDEEES